MDCFLLCFCFCFFAVCCHFWYFISMFGVFLIFILLTLFYFIFIVLQDSFWSHLEEVQCLKYCHKTAQDQKQRESRFFRWILKVQSWKFLLFFSSFSPSFTVFQKLLLIYQQTVKLHAPSKCKNNMYNTPLLVNLNWLQAAFLPRRPHKLPKYLHGQQLCCAVRKRCESELDAYVLMTWTYQVFDLACPLFEVMGCVPCQIVGG